MSGRHGDIGHLGIYHPLDIVPSIVLRLIGRATWNCGAIGSNPEFRIGFSLICKIFYTAQQVHTREGRGGFEGGGEHGWAGTDLLLD